MVPRTYPERLIFSQLMSQNLLYLVRMPKYGYILFCSNSGNCYLILINLYICVQETSSYKKSTPKHDFGHV